MRRRKLLNVRYRQWARYMINRLYRTSAAGGAKNLKIPPAWYPRKRWWRD